MSFTLAGAPAHAYVFGFQDGTSGAELQINGGTGAGGITFFAEFDENAIDSPIGWYSSNGYHDVSNGSYFVARTSDPVTSGVGYNDFFIFDIGALAETATTASIRLWSGDVTQHDWLRLGGYAGDVQSLRDGSGGYGAYNGLANGTAYGFHEYFDADDGSWQMINLNAAFLADINQPRLARIVVGGTLRGPEEPAAALAGIPEPASWAMMIMGFLGAGAVLRSGRRTAAAV